MKNVFIGLMAMASISAHASTKFEVTIAVKEYPYSMRAVTVEPQIKNCEDICPDMKGPSLSTAYRNVHCEFRSEYVDSSADSNGGSFKGLVNQCVLKGTKILQR